LDKTGRNPPHNHKPCIRNTGKYSREDPFFCQLFAPERGGRLCGWEQNRVNLFNNHLWIRKKNKNIGGVYKNLVVSMKTKTKENKRRAENKKIIKSYQQVFVNTTK
jgi:hypothetical protein